MTKIMFATSFVQTKNQLFQSKKLNKQFTDVAEPRSVKWRRYSRYPENKPFERSKLDSRGGRAFFFFVPFLLENISFARPPPSFSFLLVFSTHRRGSVCVRGSAARYRCRLGPLILTRSCLNNVNEKLIFSRKRVVFENFVHYGH